jgi:hypothetical protein
MKCTKVSASVKDRPTVLSVRNTVRFVGHSGTSEVMEQRDREGALLSILSSDGNPYAAR